MPTIADYRNKFPSLRELDDAALIDRVAEVQGVAREDVIAHMGYKPKARGILSFANDTVIEAANAVAGGVGSVANFVAPGNRVSEFIDTNIIKAGEAKQSDVVRAEKAGYRAEMESAAGIGDEIGATLGYVARNPVQSLAQAAGSFVLPGAAVKGGGMLASMAGAGAKGATRVGLAGGAVAGGALAGGDAAGTAYELVKKAGGTDEQAEAAAREASVLPAVIGAAGGVVGAERLVAGAKGFGGNAASRALKTAGVEGAQEAVEEGVTQYEGQAAAVPYDPTIDPMKGVAGAATMGAVLGGATGGAVSLLTGKPADDPKPDPVLNVLAAPDVDTAIKAAAEGLTGTKKAAPAELPQMDAEDRREVLGLMQVVNRPGVSPNVARFAQARMDALLAPYRSIPTGEATEMLPVADARELSDEERAEYANAAPFSYRRAMERGLPQPEVTEVLPTGDATEVEPIPAGDAFEEIPAPEAYETLPTGEVSDLIPTADATEFEAVPAGDASELDVETIQPTDLMAKDGEPFTSKTGAQAKAYASGGGKVVAIPNHFGSGIPGYVVRPLMPGRPSNTRGTDARDLPRSSNVNQPDVAGTAGQPVADGAGRPDAAVGGELAAGRVASDATGQQPGTATAVAPGSAGNAPVGAGNAPNTALTVQKGLTVTFGGKTYPVESINDAQEKWVRFRDSADGGMAAGVSQVGNGVVVSDSDGKFVARISYNGRAWDGENDSARVLAEAPDGRKMPQAVLDDEAAGKVRPETSNRYLPPKETLEEVVARSTKARDDLARTVDAPKFSEGQRVTLNGTPYTVTSANNTAVKLQGADGAVKMVARNSKTFGQIQPEAARETIIPANDKYLGDNDEGVPVYERQSDGFRYRLRDGRVQTGGILFTTQEREAEAAEREAGKPQEPNEAARPNSQAAAGESAAPAAAPAPAAPAVVPGAGPAAVEADGVAQPPMFESYADAQAWVAAQTKKAGGALKFRASDEYKAAYEQIKALYDAEKKGSDQERLADMKAAGLAVGDKVQTFVRSMFLGGDTRTGTIAMRGGAPIVKIDGEMAVSGPGGKLRYVQSLPWDARWKKAAPATPNAEAPVQAAPRGAEAAPVAPAPSEAERYAAGRALTKEQRKQVLDSLVDVYKAKGADREMKGQGRDGNERYGYVHSPELFEKSDITGAMVRYYVTLPDGRRAHPTELFPDYTQADVDAALAKREADEKADRENQAGAEARADKFAAPTVAAAEASWKERNKGIAGADPLRDWRTGQQYTLVTLEKGGQFYSVRNDDAALMGRLERGGWKRAETPAPAERTPKAQAVKEALARKDKPLDDLMEKLNGPEMSARPAFTAGRRVVRVVNLKQTNSALSIVADGDGFKVVVDNDMSGGLREKIAARLAEVAPAPVATHKDQGEPAEPVTPAVVREAIKTGVQDTGRKPSAMRAELLAEIDRAIEEAPDYQDFQAVVKTMGLKDATAVFTDAKGTMGEKGAPAGYSRPKRTFKVEGDGVFTIQNTVRQLLTFRAKVESSPGFKDRQAPAGLNERATDALDRRSTDAAIANMVEEGDFQAALDYAEAKEVDIGAVKLTKLLRDRLEKWQKDQASAKAVADYEAARAEGKPAPGSLAAAFAEKEAEAAPAPAAEPEADDIPEAGIASQTFDQWVRAKYAGNEYKARYLEEFGGDERRAILGAAIGTIDNDRKTPDLLKEARAKYHGELLALPRETSISLEVWDALGPLQYEAQRHFYDLDTRITRRTQDETSARVKAEREKKAPYEAAFAEVDAEIRRLDAIPGPETQKQKDLSARRERLREALYQIGQGKEPDGRLLRKDAPTPAAQAPAGRDEQPEAQALTLEAIPKSLQITLEVEDEGGKLQKKVVGARRAYLAAQQRVQKLQALKECVG